MVNDEAINLPKCLDREVDNLGCGLFQVPPVSNIALAKYMIDYRENTYIWICEITSKVFHLPGV